MLVTTGCYAVVLLSLSYRFFRKLFIVLPIGLPADGAFFCAKLMEDDWEQIN